jgi:hypothetical protein
MMRGMAKPTDTRRDLYEQAIAAFSAAHLLAAKNPRPGSPAWSEWQALVADALSLNDQYMRSLSELRVTDPPKTISN